MIKRVERGWANAPAGVKSAFFTALLVGIITHMTGITNFFQNHDSILNLFDTSKTPYGRWLSGIVGALGGSVTGTGTFIFLGVLFIAVSAGLAVAFLKIRSRLLAGLAGAMLVTFPSVVCANAYIFTAMTILISILFASLAVYCADKGGFGATLAVLFLTLALGAYQAFISYAAGLFILGLVLDLFRGVDDTRAFILRGLKYVGILILAVGLYYAVMRLDLYLHASQLTTYMGIDQVGLVRLGNIPGLILGAYVKVAKFFLLDSYGEATVLSVWLYRISLLVGGVTYLALIVKTRLYRNALHTVLSLVLMLLFPLAIHLIAVLGQTTDTHWIMMYSFVLLPVMLIAFADLANDQAGEPEEARTSGKRFFSLLAAAALVLGLGQTYMWFSVTGECYTALRLSNNATHTAAMKLCSDLIDAGCTEDTPLALIGDGQAPFFTPPSGLYSKGQYTGMIDTGFLQSTEHVYAYLDTIMGLPFTRADAAQLDAVASESEAIAGMPVYPRDGSIAYVDGVLTVKLSELEADG